MTGLQSVDPATIEAGIAMGMTDRQLLFLVEFPLALPSIVAGIRVATVIGVGTATIAAACTAWFQTFIGGVVAGRRGCDVGARPIYPAQRSDRARSLALSAVTLRGRALPQRSTTTWYAAHAPALSPLASRACPSQSSERVW